MVLKVILPVGDVCVSLSPRALFHCLEEMEKLVRKQTIETGRILETRFHFIMINNQRNNLPACVCVCNTGLSVAIRRCSNDCFL